MAKSVCFRRASIVPLGSMLLPSICTVPKTAVAKPIRASFKHVLSDPSLQIFTLLKSTLQSQQLAGYNTSLSEVQTVALTLKSLSESWHEGRKSWFLPQFGTVIEVTNTEQAIMGLDFGWESWNVRRCLPLRPEHNKTVMERK
eukprot:4160360-Amphidinium_carterae.1